MSRLTTHDQIDNLNIIYVFFNFQTKWIITVVCNEDITKSIQDGYIQVWYSLSTIQQSNVLFQTDLVRIIINNTIDCIQRNFERTKYIPIATGVITADIVDIHQNVIVDI